MASDLGLVGIADKGTYSASATYAMGNSVFYDGSTFLCVNQSGCRGITPTNDGKNWKYLAHGLTDEEIGRLGVATKAKAGMVKPGDGVNVASDGTISVKQIKTWGDLLS